MGIDRKLINCCSEMAFRPAEQMSYSQNSFVHLIYVQFLMIISGNFHPMKYCVGNIKHFFNNFFNNLGYYVSFKAVSNNKFFKSSRKN